MRLIPYSLSDVGRKRQHNEDSFLISPSVGLFAVADGMGGHRAGEKASRMAVERLRDALVPPRKGATRDEVLGHLQRAMFVTGAAIFDAAQSDPELAGMGTTLTSVLFHGVRAYVAHVGDSRAYLYRDGRVQQITVDHSWVAEQVKAGLLTEQEAKESRFRHIITRSVGFEREVQVDGTICPMQVGDCLLLCSDGLSNYLEEEEFAEILSLHLYRDVPQILVDLANSRGGDDNITVILIHLANDLPTVAEPTRTNGGEGRVVIGNQPPAQGPRQH